MIVERGIVPKPLGARIYDAINRVDAAGDKPGASRAARLSRGREGSDGRGRAGYQPAAFRPQPAGHRRHHAAADHARRFPDRVRETQRHARGAAGARGESARRDHSGLHLGRAGAADHARALSSGYAAAFERETATRMREAYVRLNQSPLGAAAFGTSSFPVDRPRLAELLGFDGWSRIPRRQPDFADRRRRRVGRRRDRGALTLGAFIADVTAQYAQTEPWILLAEGARPAPAASCRKSAIRAAWCGCAPKPAI